MSRGRIKTYDEASNEFHMLIGYCIAEWASIDDQLFRIFRHCTGAKEEQAAIIYYKTPGLNVRLTMVDEIVRSVLPKNPKQTGGHDHPNMKRWKEIFCKCNKLFATRRRIAHQPVRAQETLIPTPPPNAPYYLDMNPGLDMTLQASFEIYTSQTEQMRGNGAGYRLLR